MWFKLRNLVLNVELDILPFSVLIEWADQAILTEAFDEDICELSLSKNKLQALMKAYFLLEREQVSICDTPQPFLPKFSSLSRVDKLYESKDQIEYQIENMLIYQTHFPNKFYQRWLRKCFNKSITLNDFDSLAWLQKIFSQQALFIAKLLKAFQQTFPEWNSQEVEGIEALIWQVMAIGLNIKLGEAILYIQLSENVEGLTIWHLNVKHIYICVDREGQLLDLAIYHQEPE